MTVGAVEIECTNLAEIRELLDPHDPPWPRWVGPADFAPDNPALVSQHRQSLASVRSPRLQAGAGEDSHPTGQMTEAQPTGLALCMSRLVGLPSPFR